eukprot:2371934-Prorocentrum_lima.AAC.1
MPQPLLDISQGEATPPNETNPRPWPAHGAHNRHSTREHHQQHGDHGPSAPPRRSTPRRPGRLGMGEPH